MKRNYFLVGIAKAVGVIALVTVPAMGQPLLSPRQDLWQTDLPVVATALSGNTLYLGGNFGYVGPRSGAAGLVTEAGEARPFPKLDGRVLAIATDSSGNWYLGGNFVHTASGLANLVRVLPGGIVDTSWAPQPNAMVRCLAVAGTNLLAGGDFTTISKQGRPRIAGFSTVTGDLTPWNPNANGTVHAMAVSGSLVYVGGTFVTVGGQSRSRIACVNLSSNTPTGWNPNATGSGATIYSIIVDDGIVYCGGEFNTIGGKPRNRIAALDPNVAVNNALNWNPNASGTVYAIATDGDRVYLGGTFTSVGGLNRTNLAAIGVADGLAVDGWSPGPNGPVFALQLRGTDLLIAGRFGTVAGTPRTGMARVNTEDGALRDWSPLSSAFTNPTQSAFAIAVSQGLIAIGGDFVSFGGVRRRSLAAIDITTGKATPWNPEADGPVETLLLNGNTLYVGGQFNTLGGQPRGRLGTLDPVTGAVGTLDGKISGTSTFVQALAVYGNFLAVGGRFNSIAGVARANLASIAISTGTVDPNWAPQPNGPIRHLLPAEPALFVVGEYSIIGGSNRTQLAAVSTLATGRSTAFNSRANGAVRSLLLKDNLLYVGGAFTSIGGQTRSRFAALNTSSGDATSWNPSVEGSGSSAVHGIASSTRHLYVGGFFNRAGGEFVSNLASIDPGNGQANSWFPTPNGLIRGVRIQPPHLWIWGDFTGVGPSPTAYLAAFPMVPGIQIVATNGLPRLSVSDGDGPGTVLSIEAKESLAPGRGIKIHTRAVTGNPLRFDDPEGFEEPGRFYRAVSE